MKREWILLSDGVFLRCSISTVENLTDPGRSTSVPLRDALKNDAHLLVPTALDEGREWALSDTVGGGGEPC